VTLGIAAHDHGFGARIEGLDLSASLDAATVGHLRALWLEHQVIYFPGQPMTHAQLERYTTCFGDYGRDPFVAPVDDHPHILEIRREPAEQASPFGASWHSDWSFQAAPPSATILHAKVIPPVGGDTLYADGYRAFEALSPSMQDDLATLTAVHSARRPYSPQGFLAGGGRQRSMRIMPSESAMETREHPVVRTHPETGRRALWVNRVYTVGIRGMPQHEAEALLNMLFDHATRNEFIYAHRWEADMLTMWDNRSTQHCAQGGYDGHLRVLHRTVVAGEVPN